MSKHTPGPWMWGEGYKGLYGAGPENAVLDYAFMENMWLGGDQETVEANAALIKASPLLLAALVDCVFVMQHELNGLAVIQPELRQAMAAIAMARGEA